MAFMDGYDFENLKNETEKIVITELGSQLESYPEEICTCNDCVLDMAAMALNSAKPLYRVSLLGTLYTSQAMNEETYAAGIRQAVSRAIEKVRKNPSHEPLKIKESEPPKEKEESGKAEVKSRSRTEKVKAGAKEKTAES